MAAIEDRIVSYAKWLLKFRLWVVLASILLVFVAANGMQYIGFDTNYRVFFGKENPQLNAFEEFQQVYTKSDLFIYVVKPKDETSVFNPTTAELVQKLTEASWQIPYSIRVDSLSNFQNSYAEGDELIVEDLIEEDPNTLDKAAFDRKRNFALNEPLLVNQIIAANEGATGVVVTLQLPGESPAEVPISVAKARQTLADMVNAYPDHEVVLSGSAMMNNAFAESSKKDMATLVPIMYGIIILATLIFLRSVSGTVGTFLVVLFSILSGMGIAGWYGVNLTPPSATAPTIILTLGIADSIHFLVTMLTELRHGRSRFEAIIESLRINFIPIFITSFTTAIGFLSLNFSDSPPFGHLGNITAVGVVCAFIIAVTFLPAFMSYMPIKPSKVDDEEDPLDNMMMAKIGRFVVKARHGLIVGMVSIIVVLASFIPSLELNDEFVKYFDHSIPFRTDTEYMIDNLTGIYNVEYSVHAKEANGISDVEYLNNLERMVQWLRRQPEVIHVYSVVDIFKRLNRNMNQDDPAFYGVPQSHELAAQYLLVYEMSLPYGLDLNNRINIDKSATRLTVTTQDMSTVDMRAFKGRVEAWMSDNIPGYMYSEATGPIVMFSYISERNINSMTLGNIFALVLISLTIMVMLRSFKMGLVSLIPNIVPALIALGLWAVLYHQVNMAVAIMSAVSLGIIVDDTVHFLSKYLRARREKGLEPEEAVVYAFKTVGNALFVTTFVLAAGFGILSQSSFALNKTMGALNAMAILAAFFADFLLLGPLLITFDKWINLVADKVEK